MLFQVQFQTGSVSMCFYLYPVENTFVLQDYTRSDELWVTLSIGRVIVFENNSRIIMTMMWFIYLHTYISISRHI